MGITRRKEGWKEVEEGIGRTNGDGRRLDVGWRTHNMIYRCSVIELYT